VRATASQQQPAYLAAVLGLSTVDIGARAIVEVKQSKDLCGLGLGPSAPALTIGGSAAISGNGCALMSDTSVKYNSSPNLTGPGWAVDAVSGCVASAGHCALSGVPYNYNMLPAANPLKKLDTETFNTWIGNNPPLTTATGCPAGTSKCYSVSPNSGLGATGAYKDLTVQNGDYVNLFP